MLGKPLSLEIRYVIFVGPNKPFIFVDNYFPQTSVRDTVRRILWHRFYFSAVHCAAHDTMLRLKYKASAEEREQEQTAGADGRSTAA
jgi:hypothetical protein